MAPRRMNDSTPRPSLDVSYDSEETGGCCPVFLKGKRKTRSRQPQPSPAQKRLDRNARISTRPIEHVTEVELPMVSGGIIDSAGDEPLDSAVDSTPVKPQ